MHWKGSRGHFKVRNLDRDMKSLAFDCKGKRENVNDALQTTGLEDFTVKGGKRKIIRVRSIVPETWKEGKSKNV